MKKVILTTLLIVLINSAFAQNAVKIGKGQKAPFDGVLLTEKKAISLDKAERSNIVLRDLGLAKDELIDFHKQDARVQRRKLSEAKFRAFWVSAGYFVIGAVLTAVTFKINQKVGDI